MNRERLEHLIKVLEAVPPAKFDMEIFGRTEGFTTRPTAECATAACALGWASLDAEFQQQGLLPKAGSTINDWTPFYSSGFGRNTSHGFFAAQEFFEITLRQVYFLFNPYTYAEDFGRCQEEDKFEPEDPDDRWNDFFSQIKPEHVIERVRQLLASQGEGEAKTEL